MMKLKVGKSEKDDEGEKEKGMSVVDICSGAGGPVPAIAQWINKKEEWGSDSSDSSNHVNFILTDLYPNRKVIDRLKKDTEKFVSYESSPVDAACIPATLIKHDLRTSFGSFHHLPESVARSIFTDVVKQGSGGVAIVEATGRSLTRVLSFLVLLMPLLSILAFGIIAFGGDGRMAQTVQHPLPFVMHLLLFVYVMPWLMTLDGTLSCLRTYEPSDYYRILKQVDGAFERYDWDFYTVPTINLHKTWLGQRLPFVKSIDESLLSLRILTGIPKTHVKEA